MSRRCLQNLPHLSSQSDHGDTQRKGSWVPHAQVSDIDLIPLPLKIMKQRRRGVSKLHLSSSHDPAQIPRRHSSSIAYVAHRLEHANRDVRHASSSMPTQAAESQGKDDISARSSFRTATRSKSLSYPASRLMGPDPVNISIQAARPLLAELGIPLTHRRVATTNANGEPHQHARAGHLARNPDIKSQASSRDSFLRKMISGRLSSMTHTIQAPQVDGHRMPEPSTSPVEDVGHASRPSPINGVRHAADLDGALAKFPRPPGSRPKSRVCASLSTYSGPNLASHEHLSSPLRTTMPGAELRLIPDHSQDDLAKSMYVAIEIRSAEYDVHHKSEDPAQSMNRVDLMVVIDNSVSISPATLMTSCEITRMLAAVLDTTTDRVGILTTMPADSEGLNRPSDTSASLRPINTRQLKTALDNIISSTVALDPETLENTIRKAQEIVGTPTVSDLQSPLEQKTYGHVVVLTADIPNMAVTDMSHDRLQMHLIYPGCPPQDLWTTFSCNGWKMRVSLDEYAHATISSPKDPNSLMSRLRRWATHARSGELPISMSDLAIHIAPGPRCSIEHVMGKLRYPILLQGESKTILVKVNVAQQIVMASGYSVSRTSLSDEPSSGDDIASKIDNMLAVPSTLLLHAHLIYTHSLLPVGTVCSMSQKCHLRVLSSPDGQRIPRKAVPPKPSADAITVHRMLATHYASCQNPSEALRCLRDEFGDRGLDSSCPEYIESLTKELRYQARISERQAIEYSPMKAITVDKGNLSQVYQTPPKIMKADRENKKPYASLSAQIANTLARSENQTDVAEALGLDDAHRIWSNLRSMSRSASDAGKWRAPPTADREAKEVRMREQALRNKRSIGSSTLRSFTAPMGDYGLRMSTPFL